MAEVRKLYSELAEGVVPEVGKLEKEKFESAEEKSAHPLGEIL